MIYIFSAIFFLGPIYCSGLMFTSWRHMCIMYVSQVVYRYHYYSEVILMYAYSHLNNASFILSELPTEARPCSLKIYTLLSNTIAAAYKRKLLKFNSEQTCEIRYKIINKFYERPFIHLQFMSIRKFFKNLHFIFITYII